ncbi:MAG TPA: CAP domain-containing protein [Firmicutes bacterium]|nr:CAP domain-containing protein [Candidatus Fermentithermobacillaceae bacterium]
MKVVATVLLIGALVGTAIVNNLDKSVRDALFSQGLKAAIEAYKKAHPPQLPPNAPEKVEEANKTYVPLILKYINISREQAKLKPVILDAKLCEVARYRAQKLVELGDLTHDIPNIGKASASLRQFGLAVPKFVGENIGIYKAEKNAAYIHQDFMYSQGHRAIILEPRATRVGIGIALDEVGDKWVCEIFASP